MLVESDDKLVAALELGEDPKDRLEARFGRNGTVFLGGVQKRETLLGVRRRKVNVPLKLFPDGLQALGAVINFKEIQVIVQNKPAVKVYLVLHRIQLKLFFAPLVIPMGKPVEFRP